MLEMNLVGVLEKIGVEISPTSRCPNVVAFQRCDVAGKTQQTLSHEEAIKGRGESNIGGSKIVCSARV